MPSETDVVVVGGRVAGIAMIRVSFSPLMAIPQARVASRDADREKLYSVISVMARRNA